LKNKKNVQQLKFTIMPSFSGGCSIGIKSLTQFKTEEELRSFIQGPLAKVIYADFALLRKAELQGIQNSSNPLPVRDADALFQLQERGVEVGCSVGIRF
jgi:hypothetical protein